MHYSVLVGSDGQKVDIDRIGNTVYSVPGKLEPVAAGHGIVDSLEPRPKVPLFYQSPR